MQILVTIGLGVFEGAGVEFPTFPLTCIVVLKTLWHYRASMWSVLVIICSGEAMVPISWCEMQCPVSFSKEYRKVARAQPQHCKQLKQSWYNWHRCYWYHKCVIVRLQINSMCAKSCLAWSALTSAQIMLASLLGTAVFKIRTFAEVQSCIKGQSTFDSKYRRKNSVCYWQK